MENKFMENTNNQFSIDQNIAQYIDWFMRKVFQLYTESQVDLTETEQNILRIKISSFIQILNAFLTMNSKDLENKEKIEMEIKQLQYKQITVRDEVYVNQQSYLEERERQFQTLFSLIYFLYENTKNNNKSESIQLLISKLVFLLCVKQNYKLFEVSYFKKSSKLSIKDQQILQTLYNELMQQIQFYQKINHNHCIYDKQLAEVIKYDNLLDKTQDQVRQAVLFKLEVLMIMKQKQININHLQNKLETFYKLRKNIIQSFKNLAQINNQNNNLYYIYDIYNDILSFSHRDISIQQNQEINQINNLQKRINFQKYNQQDTCVLFSSFQNQNQLIVESVSNNFSNIFGIQQEEIILKPISNLMIDLYAKIHPNFVKNFFNQNQKSENMVHQMIFAKKDQFIIPISTQIKISYYLNKELENQFGLIALIQEIQQDRQYILYDTITSKVLTTTQQIYRQIFSNYSYFHQINIFSYFSLTNNSQKNKSDSPLFSKKNLVISSVHSFKNSVQFLKSQPKIPSLKNNSNKIASSPVQTPVSNPNINESVLNSFKLSNTPVNKINNNQSKIQIQQQQQQEQKNKQEKQIEEDDACSIGKQSKNLLNNEKFVVKRSIVSFKDYSQLNDVIINDNASLNFTNQKHQKVVEGEQEIEDKNDIFQDNQINTPRYIKCSQSLRSCEEKIMDVQYLLIMLNDNKLMNQHLDEIRQRSTLKSVQDDTILNVYSFNFFTMSINVLQIPSQGLKHLKYIEISNLKQINPINNAQIILNCYQNPSISEYQSNLLNLKKQLCDKIISELEQIMNKKHKISSNVKEYEKYQNKYIKLEENISNRFRSKTNQQEIQFLDQSTTFQQQQKQNNSPILKHIRETFDSNSQRLEHSLLRIRRDSESPKKIRRDSRELSLQLNSPKDQIDSEQFSFQTEKNRKNKAHDQVKREIIQQNIDKSSFSNNNGLSLISTKLNKNNKILNQIDQDFIKEGITNDMDQFNNNFNPSLLLSPSFQFSPIVQESSQFQFSHLNQVYTPSHQISLVDSNLFQPFSQHDNDLSETKDIEFKQLGENNQIKKTQSITRQQSNSNFNKNQFDQDIQKRSTIDTKFSQFQQNNKALNSKNNEYQQDFVKRNENKKRQTFNSKQVDSKSNEILTNRENKYEPHNLQSPTSASINNLLTPRLSAFNNIQTPRNNSEYDLLPNRGQISDRYDRSNQETDRITQNQLANKQEFNIADQDEYNQRFIKQYKQSSNGSSKINSVSSEMDFVNQKILSTNKLKLMEIISVFVIFSYVVILIVDFYKYFTIDFVINDFSEDLNVIGWPISYMSSFSYVIKNVNLQNLLEQNDIMKESPSFKEIRQESQNEIQISVLQIKNLTNQMEQTDLDRQIFENIRNTQNEFNIETHFNYTFQQTNQPINISYEIEKIEVGLFETLILIIISIYRYGYSIGQQYDQIALLDNKYVIEDKLQKIYEEAFREAYEQLDLIIESHEDVIIIFLIASFCCIFISIPIYSIIQNKKEQLLKLFGTFNPTLIYKEINQIVQLIENDYDYFFSALQIQIFIKQLYSKSTEKRQRLSIFQNKVKKINAKVILISVFSFCLILPYSILNSILTKNFVQESKLTLPVLDTLYEMQRLIIENSSMNYFCMYLRLYPSKSFYKYEDYKDQLIKNKNSSQFLISELEDRIKTLKSIQLYNQIGYNEFFYKILESDICQVMEENLDLSISDYTYNSSECLLLFGGKLTQGLNVAFTNIINIFSDLYSIYEIKDENKFLIQFDNYQKDLDIVQYYKYERYLTVIIKTLSKFILNESSTYESELLQIQTYLIIYQILLMSLIFYLGWSLFYNVMNLQLNETKQFLSLLNIRFLTSNPFIQNFLKNNLK